MEIYCHHCYVMFEYSAQRDCPSCGTRLNNWHVAKQIKAESNGAKVREIPPVREMRPVDS